MMDSARCHQVDGLRSCSTWVGVKSPVDQERTRGGYKGKKWLNFRANWRMLAMTLNVSFHENVYFYALCFGLCWSSDVSFFFRRYCQVNPIEQHTHTVFTNSMVPFADTVIVWSIGLVIRFTMLERTHTKHIWNRYLSRWFQRSIYASLETGRGGIGGPWTMNVLHFAWTTETSTCQEETMKHTFEE